MVGDGRLGVVGDGRSGMVGDGKSGVVGDGKSGVIGDGKSAAGQRRNKKLFVLPNVISITFWLHQEKVH